jgi:hypothetical protein
MFLNLERIGIRGINDLGNPSSVISLERYQDGLSQNFDSGSITQMTTPKDVSSVPEPFGLLGMGIALGIGTVATKRKSHQE